MNYIVTQEIKSKTKVSGHIYLQDFFFILGSGGFLWILSSFVHSQLRWPYYIFGGVTIIILTLPSPFNIKRRIWQSVLLFLKTDHSFYAPFKNISKCRKKDMQTEKKKNADKAMEKAWKKKSVRELHLPPAYDEKLKAYVLPDGTYMDIIKINSKDLINSDQDEIEFDSLKQAKFYKIYEDDLKLLALNFPCDLQEQIRYINRRIEKTKNKVHKAWLETQRMELEYLQKNNTTREYYFMLFADTAQRMDMNRQTAVNALGTGSGGLMSFLDDAKKHQILFKLNNKNMTISII